MRCCSFDCPRYDFCGRALDAQNTTGDYTVANLAFYGSSVRSETENKDLYVCGSLGKYSLFLPRAQSSRNPLLK